MFTGIRMLRVAALVLGLALSWQISLAQKPGPGGSPGAPPANRMPPGLPTRPDGPNNGSLNGNLYLTGKVMLDDGTPPPEPVTIERVCNGTPRAQGYTDQKGRFSFQIGQTSGVLQDASEGGPNFPGATQRSPSSIFSGINQPTRMGASDVRLDNCDLRGVLAGFRSDNVILDGRHLLDDPDVGTITLHRLGNVEGSAISMTSLQAPPAARKAYDKARQLLRKEKPAEAAKELQKAVGIYPKYAAAWYQLGRIRQQNGDVAGARQSFASAMAADAKFISPYLPLIELAAKSENWAELADTAARLIKLDAVDYPSAYFYHAIATLNLGQIEEAEKSARAGEKLDIQHQSPKLEQVLAMILARKKDYAGAIEHLRSYLLFASEAEDATQMRKMLDEWRRMTGASQQARVPGWHVLDFRRSGNLF